MIGSALATEHVPAYSGNYTAGRSGRPIKAITLHHMAARWTARRCGEDFQREGRKGSTHYGIGYDGEIAQYVSETDTAWSNSDWDSNLESVTIECSDESMGHPWPVSDATLNSAIRLVADIAQRNDLGLLVKGKNLTWHQMFTATACPGPYLLSKLDYIIEEANKIITGGKPMTKKEVNCKYKVFTDKWLPDVTGHDQNDHVNGYAGNLGEAVRGVLANASEGNLFYRVHVKGGSWLPEVKNRQDYAGILDKEIDGFMIRSDVTTVHYKVHTRADGWLPPVTGYNAADPANGYAGVLGHTIDGVSIWADPIVEAAPEPEPTPEKVEPTEKVFCLDLAKLKSEGYTSVEIKL